MDANHRTSDLKNCKLNKIMHEKESAFSLNGDMELGSGYIMNGYSGKPTENYCSGSEPGYTTTKKRRARRSSVKSVDNTSQERETAMKRHSEQDTESSSQETSGSVIHSQINCTMTTCLKPEVHTGVCRMSARDTSPVAEVQNKNTDRKISLRVKKTDAGVCKTKLVSSVSSKEDPWTLFKPPPVFPVDNSSAKIVPKISYASKVKENLKAAQATGETSQISGKLFHVSVPANLPLDANGCYSAEMSFGSAAGLNVAPSASFKQDEEDVKSASDDGCSQMIHLSNPEPRKLVYPHKPLNMQSAAAAPTNKNALGDIFQNQWGLSFINEPNAGPVGVPVSRPVVSFEISDVTFQGGNLPFIVQPSVNAVSLPADQNMQRRSNGTEVAISHTASQNCPQAQPAFEESLDAEDTRNCTPNSVPSLSKVHFSKEQGGAHGWGWADVQAAVLYHTEEFEYLLTLHKQYPDRVNYYQEVINGPGH